MRKALFFSFVLITASLAACREDAPDDAAARRAEATEARMDAEAARMVAAADSVRAVGEQTADSLRGLKTSKSKALER